MHDSDTSGDRSDSTDDNVPHRPRGCAGLFFVMAMFGAAVAGVGLGAFLFFLRDVESTISTLDDYRPKIGSRMYSSDDQLMGEFAVEDSRRQVVPLSEIPLRLQKAFVATEDHKFYEHKGVRPLALMAAAVDAVRTNHMRGASTITQQIVRNIEGTGVTTEETVERKLKEMLVALQLERRFTKDEILELYLNQIFLGVSANGVEAAARQYFDKSVEDLTLGECAMLAGLTRSPNRNNPFRSMENAHARRDIVLAQMLNHGFITQEEHDAAVAEDLNDTVLTDEQRELRRAQGGGAWTPDRFSAPYFSEEVRQFISRPPAPHEVGATQEELFEGGLEVYTTIDMRLQRIAEEVLHSALQEFDEKKLESLTKAGRESEFIPVSGALICLDNRVGDDYDYRGFVRAMVGGRDFTQKKFNFATQAQRQPGSSVKPFVWLAALDNGITPSEIIVDEPVTYVTDIGVPWEPENFDGTFHGAIAMRKALELSVNVVSVKLVERLGMPLVRSYLRSAGFQKPIGNEVGLTLALGTPVTTVIDQAVCYSTLANLGVRVSPVMVTEVRDRDGIIRYDYRDFRQIERVFPEDASYQIVHLLGGVCEPWRRGHSDEQYFVTGRRTAEGGFTRPRGGKTGTTQNSYDTWFCGFSSQYTCVVWIGYENNTSLGKGNAYTGGALVSPIWTEFMVKAHEGMPERDFRVPAGVEFYEIDRATGLLDQGNYREAYIRGTKPPTQMPIFMPETLEQLVDPSVFSSTSGE